MIKYLLLLLILIGCNSKPKEDKLTVRGTEAGETISYAKAITNGTFVWVDTVGNQEITITSREVQVTDKDTVIVTNNYTTRTLDTTWRTLSTTPPPVDTVTPPPVSGYALTFESGYDKTSDITYGGNGQYGKEPASMHVSTTTYKTGPGSFYSVPADVSNGTRSEVQYTGSAQNPIEGAVEYDVRYEVIIPNNGHSFQWHPNTSGGSASPGLWHEGGRFTWYNWKQGGNYVIKKQFFTIPLNQWLHMRIEYKFGSQGYFRHWIDGSLKVDYSGQVGDGSGQYVKVGYNGWDANSAKSRLYIDNLKIYRKL